MCSIPPVFQIQMSLLNQQHRITIHYHFHNLDNKASIYSKSYIFNDFVEKEEALYLHILFQLDALALQWRDYFVPKPFARNVRRWMEVDPSIYMRYLNCLMALRTMNYLCKDILSISPRHLYKICINIIVWSMLKTNTRVIICNIQISDQFDD